MSKRKLAIAVTAALVTLLISAYVRVVRLEKKVDQLVCQFREQCAPAAEEAAP